MNYTEFHKFCFTISFTFHFKSRAVSMFCIENPRKSRQTHAHNTLLCSRSWRHQMTDCFGAQRTHTQDIWPQKYVCAAAVHERDTFHTEQCCSTTHSDHFFLFRLILFFCFLTSFFLYLYIYIYFLFIDFFAKLLLKLQ